MKKPVFFVQNNYVQRLTIPVAQFAHAHGYALEDRSAHSDFNPEDCGIDWNQYHPVLPYGSVQFMRCLKDSPQLGRFILHSEDAFSTEHWAGVFGERAVNHRGRLVAAGDVAALLQNGQKYHVRPDRQDKAFIAAVFDSASWQQECDKRNISPELPCWASPVVALHGEWRCWVVGGKVVDISQYRKEGQPHRVLETCPDIHSAAQALADIYLPAPVVVMDIAATDEGIQVLEFNPIHGSGWYAARVDFVLESWLQWAIAHFGPPEM
jgi:hypothetical protein